MSDIFVNSINVIRHESFRFSMALCVSYQAAEACGSLEIDNALETVRNLEKELESIKKTAEDGTLRTLPGENVSAPSQ